MAQLYKALGRYREFPMLEGGNVASSAVNVNYEHPLVVLPALSSLAGAGQTGMVPAAAMRIREVYLVAEATLTGVNTNTVTLNILQKRAGALVVNTTATTAVAAAGLATITPASMTGIVPGSTLALTGGTGTAENIVVISTTNTTFNANFVNTHSGTYNLVSVPLASIAFVAGTNLAALTPTLLTPVKNNVLLPGDIVTVQTVNAGTGLATPAMLVELDWEIVGAA